MTPYVSLLLLVVIESWTNVNARIPSYVVINYWRGDDKLLFCMFLVKPFATDGALRCSRIFEHAKYITMHVVHIASWSSPNSEAWILIFFSSEMTILTLIKKSYETLTCFTSDVFLLLDPFSEGSYGSFPLLGIFMKLFFGFVQVFFIQWTNILLICTHYFRYVFWKK